MIRPEESPLNGMSVAFGWEDNIGRLIYDNEIWFLEVSSAYGIADFYDYQTGEEVNEKERRAKFLGFKVYDMQTDVYEGFTVAVHPTLTETFRLNQEDMLQAMYGWDSLGSCANDVYLMFNYRNGNHYYGIDFYAYGKDHTNIENLPNEIRIQRYQDHENLNALWPICTEV